jgi:hypothetical protein
MKSALANIGEKNLSNEAAKLEKAGREQDIKMIMSKLPSFMEMLCSVIEKHEIKDDNDDKKKKDDDKPFLKQKLEETKEDCKKMDKKSAKGAINEIKEKTWSAQVKEWLSVISENLLHSEFEETEKLINDYLKQL